MKKINVILLCLVAAVALAFAGVLIYDRAQYERDLRNYPTAYTDLIAQYAEEFALDPYLLTAIMRCESSNDPNAVSSKGAIGLMQIMPDTGAWIAHKLDMDDAYADELLFEPAVNIRYACWYVAFLTRRLNGDRTSIIAAYNAGHGSVEQWLSDPAYSSDGVLTSIPYPETARYLVKVDRAYEKYTTLYPELYGAAVAEPPAA